MARVISLLTDFGLRDPYVGEVKATLLKDCPGAVLVDVTHQVEPENIVEGAYLLEMAVPYFPAGTVHLAVVDPGVGSERLPIAIECQEGSVLVGPDNGLLVPASRLLGVNAAYKIDSPGPTPNKISSTFHGRDIFAVAAAKIASGIPTAKLGPRVRKLVQPVLLKVSVGLGRVDCSVVHVDVFGNVITSAKAADLKRAGFKQGRTLRLKWRTGSNTALYSSSYYEVERGKLLVLEGSQGYVEVASREDSAAGGMNVKSLDRLTIRG